jgi:hypothetical protein
MDVFQLIAKLHMKKHIKHICLEVINIGKVLIYLNSKRKNFCWKKTISI